MDSQADKKLPTVRSVAVIPKYPETVHRVGLAGDSAMTSRRAQVQCLAVGGGVKVAQERRARLKRRVKLKKAAARESIANAAAVKNDEEDLNVLNFFI